jgi:hypothetical protein
LETFWGNVAIAIRKIELDRADWYSQWVGVDLRNWLLGSHGGGSAALEICSLVLRLDGKIEVNCGRDEINLVLNMCWHAIFLDS